MSRRFLLALALLGTRLAAAQGTGVVHGQVRDTLGRPLAEVDVQVLGTRIKALTSASGAYRLAGIPSGPRTLRVNLPGYRWDDRAVTVPDGDSIRVDVTLQALFRMGPIEVTTTTKGRSEMVEQSVTSVAVVSDTQVARRATNTVDEAIDKAPAVQMLEGQVNIRGSSGFAEGLGSRVLLLVDGVPANQGDRGGINWDVIPVDRIDHIEIVKGAGSALYGSAAFGGVVNLITRDLPEGLHYRVRATSGAFANPPQEAWDFRDHTGIQGGGDVAVSYGSATLRGGISGGARHTDGYREQDQADHWQATAKGEWHPDPVTRIALNGALASDQYDVYEPWCTAGECSDTTGQAYLPFRIKQDNAGNFTRSDKTFLSATAERAPSEHGQWFGRASWFRTHFDDLYPNRIGSTVDYSTSNRYGAEGRYVAHPNPHRIVTVGVEAAYSDIYSNIFSGDTSNFDGGSHTQGEYAAYLSGEEDLGPARLTIGARADFLTVDGGALTAVVSPRVGVVIPTRTGSWRASVGRGFRAPSLAERFVTTYALGVRVVPNPALEPELAWAFEVGRSWVPLNWLRADIAGFWTEAQKLIEPELDTTTFTIQFNNLQRGRLAGLDLAVEAQPFTPRLVTSASYMYLYTRDLSESAGSGEPLPFRPAHLLTLSGDYDFGPLTVGGDFRFSSRIERVELYDADPRVAAKTLDLRAGGRWGPLGAQLILRNALNYIYNFAPRILEPVRTLTLTLTYTH